MSPKKVVSMSNARTKSLCCKSSFVLDHHALAHTLVLQVKNNRKPNLLQISVDPRIRNTNSDQNVLIFRYVFLFFALDSSLAVEEQTAHRGRTKRNLTSSMKKVSFFLLTTRYLANTKILKIEVSTRALSTKFVPEVGPCYLLANLHACSSSRGPIFFPTGTVASTCKCDQIKVAYFWTSAPN
jgi:hypothetical protein